MWHSEGSEVLNCILPITSNYSNKTAGKHGHLMSVLGLKIWGTFLLVIKLLKLIKIGYGLFNHSSFLIPVKINMEEALPVSTYTQSLTRECNMESLVAEAIVVLYRRIVCFKTVHLACDCVYLCVRACTSWCMCGGQKIISRVTFFLLCGLWKMNSSNRAWQQVPLWPFSFILNAIIYIANTLLEKKTYFWWCVGYFHVSLT